MNKIKLTINSFFSKIGNSVKKFKEILGETKFLKSIKTVFNKFVHSLAKFTRYEKLSYRKQKFVWSLIFLSPVIIGYAVFFLYPFVLSVFYSFSEIKTSSEGFQITFIGWKNFKEAISVDPEFGVTLLKSTFQTFINIPVLLIFSLLIAVMINGKFRGRTFVRAVFFIPVVLNSEAINIVMGNAENLGNTLNQLGNGALTQIFDMKMFLESASFPPVLVNFLSSLTTQIYSIITYSGIQILIFLAAIQSVPSHLYEAAKIEGANKYEAFWKITLPMVMPMVLTALVYTVVDSFLRSPVNKLLDKAYLQHDYGLNAAMSWLYMGASLIIIAFYFLVFGKAGKVHEEDR